jgi:hypothetical protein
MADKADKKKIEKAPAPKAANGSRLPILWELVNTFSQLIVTLTGLGVAVSSYIHGSNILTSALKGGAAMVCIGVILYVVYWMIARGSLELMSSLYKERQLEMQNQSAGLSTLEFRG